MDRTLQNGSNNRASGNNYRHDTISILTPPPPTRRPPPSQGHIHQLTARVRAHLHRRWAQARAEGRACSLGSSGYGNVRSAPNVLQ